VIFFVFSFILKMQSKVTNTWHFSASLNQELQDMEALALRGQNKSQEEANQMIQVPLQGCMVHFVSRLF
jgi:hypothetical protein